MKKNSLLVFALATTMVLASCGGKKQKTSYDEMGPNGRTTRTECLAENLRSFADRATIVGQEYGTLMGVGWKGDSARSDMQSVSGMGPAALAYELCGIERGLGQNVDTVSFEDIRLDVLQNFKKGALMVMKWTVPEAAEQTDTLLCYVERVALWLDTLQDGYGIKAPVLFLPFFPRGDTWYEALGPDAFRERFHIVAEGLRKAGTTNVVLGFSAFNMADLEERCPIDDVEVIHYQGVNYSGDIKCYAEATRMDVPPMLAFAQEHFKAFGMTTGLSGGADTRLFSDILLPLVQNYHIGFLLFGRNQGDPAQGRFCIPFPGLGNEAIADFVTFANDSHTTFISQLNGLYLPKRQ